MGVVFLSFKMGFRPEKILFTSLMGHVVRLPYLFFGAKTNIGTTGHRVDFFVEWTKARKTHSVIIIKYVGGLSYSERVQNTCQQLLEREFLQKL